MRDAANNRVSLRMVWDTIVTLLLWIYFTLGFILFFAPLYLLSALVGERREAIYQRLNQIFFGIFIYLTRLLTPAHDWMIDPAIRTIRSSVIVSNHRSYLDPLILISLFPRQKTIVKSWLFSVPIFGHLMRWTGFMPSDAKGAQADLILSQMASLASFFKSGGNLFIFPEGTRTRDGRIGTLHPSAFKIARRCRATMQVLFIKNTEKVFAPGCFLFNTRGPVTVSVQSIGEITANEWSYADSRNIIHQRVKEMLEKHNHQSTSDTSIQQAPFSETPDDSR